MDYGLLIRTVIHLKPGQMLSQVKHRLRMLSYVPMEAPEIRIPELRTFPIARFHCVEDDSFSFLNQEHGFAGWDFTGNGMLWAYNQNYFDWINQEDISKEACCKWIDLFVDEIENGKWKMEKSRLIGLDPYPIALRSINWIKFFCRHPECAVKPRLDSLYSQLRLLEKKLEYHLMGNHLLEDAYALYIGSAFFNDKKMRKKAGKLLMVQLEEQILPDGAHYEQSPMYHCILLDRLLDCINIQPTEELKSYARRMLGHIGSIVWADDTIPLLNDSAIGIAPAPKLIFDYARRLGLEWENVPLRECGYKKMKNFHFEAIVDVGDILASYQPGHSHADTFNFELRVDGKPFIIDTGISTYDKNERRQQERSTSAHNTVVVDDKNSSEVWGGFRIGKRAKVTIIEGTPQMVSASHDGYGKNGHKRTFKVDDEMFVIIDETVGGAVGYLHFAPKVTISEFDNNQIVTDLAIVELANVNKIKMKEGEVNTVYSMPVVTKVAELYFDRKMTIKFKQK